MISVIVPVFNVEKYLCKCVDSILKQTYENIEVILVDDGSTDESGTICDKYISIDKRVKVFHKENEGVSAARNFGIEHASGQYIAFVDSDDYISPLMYEKMIQRIKRDNSDLVVCNYCRFDEGTIPSNLGYINLDDAILTKQQVFDLYSNMYGGDYVAVWNKLYKKDIFQELRYPIGKKYEDTFVIHRIIDKCTVVSHMEDVLYFYMMRQGSILHEKFNIKDFDIGEAIIGQYWYAKLNKQQTLLDFCVKRLSYRFETWKLYQSNKEFRKRYYEIRNKSWFLLFERNAWGDYSIKGKIMARLKFLF